MGRAKASNTKFSSYEGRSFLDRMGSGVWGLGIAVLGTLMFMAVVSYLWNSAGQGGRTPGNLVGPVGSWLAHIVFYLFGLGAFILAGAAMGLGALLISLRSPDLKRAHLLGLAVLLFPVMVLLHSVFPTVSALPTGNGGIVGYLFASLLEALINKTGTVLLALAAAVAGVSIIFRVHVKMFFIVPYRLAVSFWRGLAARRRAARAATGTQEVGEDGSGGPRVVRTGAAKEQATNLARPVPQDAPAEPPPEAESPAPEPEPEASGDAAGGKTTPPERDEAPEPEPEPETRPGRPAEAAASTPSIVTPVSDLKSEDECLAESVDGEEVAGKDGHVPAARVRRQEEAKKYELPELGLLDYHTPVGHRVDDDSLRDSAEILEQTLSDFRVDGNVGDIHPGPVIALFEFKPARGIKVSQIAGLSKDIAMALAAEQVRVIAPIPGRDVVGFEIPNKVREMVYLRELLSEQRYRDGKFRLPLVLGKDIGGKPTITDLTKMPHLLVAGTTGSGKSVALHSFILSILYRLTPDQVKLVLVDTKMLELTAYSQIPHLLLPVVTEAKDAAVALRWAVGEMERRNRLMSAAGVPNIHEYNQLVKQRRESPGFRATVKKISRGPDGARREEVLDTGLEDKELPYIVVVIDELADLMMVAGKQVESTVARLAQMARAAGIHMIIATQNPTIKVVTGIIKANMPSRVSFKVRTMQDSRVILDQNGADDLLGWGDMLFLGPGSSKLQRIHGAFVSTEERTRVVDFLRSQGEPEYNLEIMESGGDEEEEYASDIRDSKDDLYAQAVNIAVARGKISTSALQRELGIGYNKAAVLMSRMEKEGIVGPPEAAGKPRVVLRSS